MKYQRTDLYCAPKPLRLFPSLALSKFYSKMSSTRPTRSCRVTPTAPILPEIMARINDLNGKYYENIRNEFNSVVKYYKEDSDSIASFWLTHYEYNMLDFKHHFLMKCLFNQVGLKHPDVVDYLNKIQDEEILRKMEVVRVNNGKKIFYRIRVGLESDY